MKHITSLLSIAAIFLLTSCIEEAPETSGLPDVNLEISDSGTLVFEMKGNLPSNMSGKITECGFYVSENSSLQDAEKFSSKLTGTTFAANVTLNEYGKTYYVSAFVSNGRSEVLSKLGTCKVRQLSEYVTFQETSVSGYDRQTETANLSIPAFEVKKGVNVSKYGVIYGTSTNLTQDGTTKILSVPSAGEIVSFDLTGLKTGTQYYICQFINDGNATAYSQKQTLNVFDIPVVEIGEITDVTPSSATVAGTVSDTGGKKITERGVVYAKGNKTPTLETGKVMTPDTISYNFKATITGLLPKQLYSVRTYAINSEGIAYSPQTKQFTTLVGPPSVTTDEAASISGTSATLNATITSDGGETITDCGFYWSTSPSFSIDSAQKVKGNIAGNKFSAYISNLNIGTDYYFKAFVSNSVHTAYGKSSQFTTLDYPTVTLSSITDVTYDSATIKCNVSSDGGSTITERGVVYIIGNGTTSIENGTKVKKSGTTGSYEITLSGLSSGTTYSIRAYAVNKIGISYSDVAKEFTTKIPTTIDLDCANCFIVSKVGLYRFQAVKGNSSTSVGSISRAEVLWESFGTSVTPSVGDLIKSVTYSNGYITFSTNSSFKEGNAVIAAKDASGTILWSWHIWLTDEPQGQTYYNNAGVMMDRNLGATSATPGDVGALGLLYQWGRKDPFLGSSSINSSVVAKSTISWPSPVSSSSSTGTIDYAVQHPTTFITNDSGNYDWYYTGSESTDDTRWQSQKTIYDPCPAGWRVLDGGTNGVWAKAVGSSGYFEYYYNSTSKGMNFSGKFESATTIWYPASGCLFRTHGTLSSVGYSGYYWSVTPAYGENAYYLSLYNSGDVYPAVSDYRSYGYSVRCLQE